MRDVYIHNTNELPNLIDLKHTTIGDYEPFFKGKSFQLRKAYVGYYQKFCNQVEFSDTKKFSEHILGGEKRLLNSMWADTVNKKYQTFDSIRKLVQINRWSRGYIDSVYDIIFIDEAQDFDPLMLHILLNDVNAPKVFVGDPLQSIYSWRGCINSFDNLPKTSRIIEFYSTFRIGEPACTIIRKSFDNCWMISKSANKTVIVPDKNFNNQEYVYLFRTWKCLLQTAANIATPVWICNFESQIEFIKKLHQKLQYSDLSDEDRKDFSDDLPAFLIKLTFEQLDELLYNVKKNYTNDKSLAKCLMYTIHSYKGLEHDRIKIHDDIGSDEHNLRYVALTRGKSEIVIAITAS
jgi:superfamily I DNA/RNA helicase